MEACSLNEIKLLYFAQFCRMFFEISRTVYVIFTLISYPILFYTDFSLECFKVFSIFKNLQSYLIVLVSQPSMFPIKWWKQWARYLKHTAKTRRGYFSCFYYFFLRTISQKVNNRNTRKRCKMCLKLTV